MSDPMKSTWLVQRLEAPRGHDNPFSFGGGGGRLTPDALDLLRPVWSFGYMGAAEFEFGSVPEALGRMVKAKLAAFTLDLTLPVYVICPKAWVAEVTERITDWATSSTRPRMKESMHFDLALAGEEWVRACGWLELDNGFLFFTDRTMFERACHLFGIDVAVAP